jgi:methionyl-tRNA formyltransferase
LLAGPHDVVCVVSQPDRRRGRGRKTSPSPVAQVALRADIALLRPEAVGHDECVAALRATAPDLGIVVAFGQFIPKKVRTLPGLGYLLNAHASLLPRYRGAAPIARAVLAGERVTGISVMRIEREMDAGPVALVRSLEIGPDETTGELEGRLASLAAEAIAEATDRAAEGALRWTEQDAQQATLAPKIERDEARLDWRQNAVSLANRVRAMAPKPGAVTTLDGEPLRILAARAAAEPSPGDPPGTVRHAAGPNPLRIATGSGWLVPRRLQRAGGKPLDVGAFLRGRPVPDGTRLGNG